MRGGLKRFFPIPITGVSRSTGLYRSTCLSQRGLRGRRARRAVRPGVAVCLPRRLGISGTFQRMRFGIDLCVFSRATGRRVARRARVSPAATRAPQPWVALTCWRRDWVEDWCTRVDDQRRVLWKATGQRALESALRKLSTVQIGFWVPRWCRVFFINKRTRLASLSKFT